MFDFDLTGILFTEVSSVRLSKAVLAYLNSRKGIISPKTFRIYRQSLELLSEFIGNRNIENINLDDLREFRSQLFDRHCRYRKNTSRPQELGGLSRWTIHGHIRVVRQLFKWLTDEKKIRHNPAERLELPELGNEPPKGISEQDIEKMLNAARESTRDYALLLFLAQTGARLGGVAGLQIGDLDLKRGRATVREKGRRGRIRSRTVYFTQRVGDALRAWMEEREKHSKAAECQNVFIGRKGALTPCGIYLIVNRIAGKARVRGRHNPHSFRHGLARKLIENGLDLARVSKILGHSSEVVTARFYAVFADHEIKIAHSHYTWLR